jgi:hypothetical protein
MLRDISDLHGGNYEEMPPSGMLSPVVVIRTDVLEELLVTANAVPSSLILVNLMMEAKR